MNNLFKAISWSRMAIKPMLYSGASGAFFGFIAGIWSSSSHTHINDNILIFILFGGFIGLIVGGIIPAILFVWFLFLHMIGQVSGAIKGK